RRSSRKSNVDSTPTRTQSRTSSSSSSITIRNINTTTTVTAPLIIPARKHPKDVPATMFSHLISKKEDVILFETKRDSNGKRAWHEEMLRRSREMYDLHEKAEWEKEIGEAMARTEVW
ncbi:MAG: hypothetical protein Q9224_006589, partial [Gallowayella concinna]